MLLAAMTRRKLGSDRPSVVDLRAVSYLNSKRALLRHERVSVLSFLPRLVGPHPCPGQVRMCVSTPPVLMTAADRAAGTIPLFIVCTSP